MGKALLAIVESQVKKTFDPYLCLFFLFLVKAFVVCSLRKMVSSKNCTLTNFCVSENESSVSEQAR